MLKKFMNKKVKDYKKNIKILWNKCKKNMKQKYKKCKMN